MNQDLGFGVIESYNAPSIQVSGQRVLVAIGEALSDLNGQREMSCNLEECVSQEPSETNEHKPSGAAATRANPEYSLMLAMAAVKTAAENGAQDLVVLDMSKHTAIFDYFVIATGTSRRQLHAISEEIDHKLEDELNDKRMNIDGYDDSKWIVLDYGTVVIHLFDEDTRVFYSLEALWGDAAKVDLTETLKNVR